MKTKLLLIVFLLNVSYILIAQIIHVPGDQPSIQDGINAANNGDTVLVAEDTYYENINFKGKTITVASDFILDGDTTHINNTIINGSQPLHPDSASVVSFISGEDTTSIICGFTITEGGGLIFPSAATRAGGGIICWNSGATIINNKIIENEVSFQSNAFGGGIAASSSGGIYWIVIGNNVISNNNVTAIDLDAAGGGLDIEMNARVYSNIIEQNNCESELQYAFGGGTYCISGEFLTYIFEFKNNRIKNNHAIGSYVYGGGLYTLWSELNMAGNEISNNILTGGNAYGGGLYALWSELSISNNEISNNNLTGVKAWGGGLYIRESAGKIDLSENEINNNVISVDEIWLGCGIYINEPGAKTEIIRNIISGNTGPGSSSSWGGGIYLNNPLENEVIMDGNIFSDNISISGGGLYAKAVLNCIFTNNVFFNNTAQGSGGAVFLKEPTSGDDANKLTKISYSLLSDSTHFVMVNNTFSNNSAASYGGAVCCNYILETINIFNSIFWENEGGTGTDVHHSGINEINISYSNIDTAGIDGNWVGTNNINYDPLFVDPINGDFHLYSCASPCINAGIDSLEINETWFYSPSTDIDNEARPYENTFPDIGADETSCLLITEIFHQETLSSTLLKSFPNPFKYLTTIELNVQQTDFVRLSILDFTGKEIQTLVSEYLLTGIHQFEWNASNLPNGIYFLRLETNGISENRKLIMLN